MEAAKKILIVDDEMSIRLTTSALLSMSGYEVDAVSGGYEAMEKLPDFNPDVILLDIMFPGRETGIDFCRKIKSNPRWAGVKIIMITAVADKNTVIEVAKAGACGYIVKPFRAETVTEKIEEVLAPVLEGQAPAGEADLAPVINSPPPRRGSGLASRGLSFKQEESGERGD